MRHQLPVYSPLTLGAITKAARSAVTSPWGALGTLSAFLAERFSAEDVILTGTGTQALQLALESAISSANSEERPVALPAYSCFDVVTAAVGANVRVVFYDIDPVSLTPDLDSLRLVLESGAGVVVVGNLYGFPINWPELRAVCEPFDVVVIEDAAQGIGSEWNGREGGGFGDVTVLSFGRGKGWTGGGGGALLRRAGPELAHRELSSSGLGARSMAGSVVQWGMGRPSLYGIPMAIPGLGLGDTHYKEPMKPRTMTPYSAAAVLALSEPAEREVRRRRRGARRWQDVVADDASCDVKACAPLAEGGCGFLRFPLVAADGKRAEELSRAGRTFGVARGYPAPLPTIQAVAPLVLRPSPYMAGAAELAASLLTLPTHSLVSNTDQLGIVGMLGRI